MRGLRFYLVVMAMLLCVDATTLVRAGVFSPIFDVVSRSELATPLLVPGPDNVVTVIWVANGVIERRVLNGNGIFGSVAALPKLTTDAASNPAAVADLLGRVHVVWQEGGKIMSHRLSPIGALTQTRMLSNANASNASDPAVAVDSLGRAAVVWSRGNAIEAIRLSGAAAQPVGPVAVMSAAHQDSPPGIAVDASGEATVVWRRQGNIEYQRLAANGAILGEAITIDGFCAFTLPRIAGHPLSSRRPVIVARGLSTAICFNGQFMWRILTEDGFVDNRAATISAHGGLDADPGHRIAMAADGLVRFAWRQDLGGSQNPRRLCTRRQVGADTVCTSVSHGDVEAAELAIDDDGLAAMAWLRGSAVFTSTIDRNDGGFLTGIQQPTSGAVTLPQVALDGDSRRMVLWRRQEGGSQRLQGRREVGPPLCQSPLTLAVASDAVAPAIFIREICAGWIDESAGAPVVQIIQAPAIGTIEVLFGAILYRANGGGYSETFRLQTTGPGGASNPVEVQVNVLSEEVIFADGFEPSPTNQL